MIVICSIFILIIPTYYVHTAHGTIVHNSDIDPRKESRQLSELEFNKVFHLNWFDDEITFRVAIELSLGLMNIDHWGQINFVTLKCNIYRSFQIRTTAALNVVMTKNSIVSVSPIWCFANTLHHLLLEWPRLFEVRSK